MDRQIWFKYIGGTLWQLHLNIKFFNGCQVRIENSITWVTVWHHEACHVISSAGVFNFHKRWCHDVNKVILTLWPRVILHRCVRQQFLAPVSHMEIPSGMQEKWYMLHEISLRKLFDIKFFSMIMFFYLFFYLFFEYKRYIFWIKFQFNREFWWYSRTNYICISNTSFYFWHCAIW